MLNKSYNYKSSKNTKCSNSNDLLTRKNYNYGPVEKAECPNCNETDYWQLIKSEFIKYYIGIPFKKTDSTKYMLVCSKCKEKILLTKNEFEKFKSLAELNKLYLNGLISKQAYLQKHKQYTNNIIIRSR